MPTLSLTMNIPERSDSKEKATSPASSLPTPPDSAEELSTLQLQSSSSSAHSLSQPAQCAFDIIKSVKQGRVRPENSWIKLRLEPGDFSLLKERLKVKDLWGYVKDKIRYDYNPQTCLLIFRMPTSIHEIFTGQVNKEIDHQLQRLGTDVLRPDVAALARSIQPFYSSDIYLPGDSDQGQRSPDSSFRHNDARFPFVIIETSFSQKKKDLPRLADDYIIGSNGNIKLVIGLDIEYRNSKKATVSVWESKEQIEDGVLCGYAEKIVDNKPFRNDDSSPTVSENTLVIPLSIFTLPGDASLLLSPDALISIPYTALYSFLKNAEFAYQATKREDPSGLEMQQPPGKRWKRRQATPEEKLGDSDEARFVASEEKVERQTYEEDCAWGER